MEKEILDKQIDINHTMPKSPLREIIDTSSPRTKKKILQHEIKAEDVKYENTWESCCIKMDKRAIQYFSQLALIAGVMGFCVNQLVVLHDCESQTAYLGLLTLLIGILVPNPKLESK